MIINKNFTIVYECTYSSYHVIRNIYLLVCFGHKDNIDILICKKVQLNHLKFYTTKQTFIWYFMLHCVCNYLLCNDHFLMSEQSILHKKKTQIGKRKIWLRCPCETHENFQLPYGSNGLQYCTPWICILSWNKVNMLNFIFTSTLPVLVTTTCCRISSREKVPLYSALYQSVL